MRKRGSKENRENKNIGQIQEAKAKFSQLVEEANLKGEPIAVILSKKEFDKISQSKTSLLNFFKAAPCQEIDLYIERSKDLPRESDSCHRKHQ